MVTRGVKRETSISALTTSEVVPRESEIASQQYSFMGSRHNIHVGKLNNDIVDGEL